MEFFPNVIYMYRHIHIIYIIYIYIYIYNWRMREYNTSYMSRILETKTKIFVVKWWMNFSSAVSCSVTTDHLLICHWSSDSCVSKTAYQRLLWVLSSMWQLVRRCFSIGESPMFRYLGSVRIFLMKHIIFITH